MIGDFLGLVIGAVVFALVVTLMIKKGEDGTFTFDLIGLVIMVITGYLFLSSVYTYIQKYIV